MTTSAHAESTADLPQEIAGYRTIYGATASAQATPVPPRYVFGADRDWHQQPFRAAVVLIEFPDKKHADVHSAEMYNDLLFSKGRYLVQPDGKPSFGSMADWYDVQSHGRFVLTGQVFDWVTIEKTFDEIHKMKSSEARQHLFKVAMDVIREREGKDVFEGYDAYIFIHAGPITGPSGNILWSHQSRFEGKRYFTTGEIERIGVFCHEWGHVLGLPDLYSKEGVREGFGPWCSMAAGYRGIYPKSLCVWAKTRIGWCQPTILDPTSPQQLVLRPIQQNPNDTFLIPLQSIADGSNADKDGELEFLMLENRTASGNDLEGQAGLYIWRIKGKYPKGKLPSFQLTLPGPDDKPGTNLNSSKRRVVWPDGEATAYTVPAEENLLPVSIKNIRADGDLIFFDVGIE